MKKILQIIFDDSIEIREQLFRNILLVGTFSVIISTIECIVLGNLKSLLWSFIIMFLALGVSIVLTLKYHKLETASMIIGVVLVFITRSVFW